MRSPVRGKIVPPSSQRPRVSRPRAQRSRPGSRRRRQPPRLRRPRHTSVAGPPAPSAGASLAWPVSGPVTSGFGARWGRMHEGIDIAVPSGTPVHAAAAGNRGLRRLARRIRKHRRDRPRQRALDGLRAQLEPERRAGSLRGCRERDRALGQHRPLDRAARALRGAGQRRSRWIRRGTCSAAGRPGRPAAAGQAYAYAASVAAAGSASAGT